MYEAEVAAGAAYLDQKRPGWDREIDLGTLSFPSTRDCVLGQLYGGYHRGTEALDVFKDDTTASLGFYLCNSRNYEALCAAWCELISERRARDRMYQGLAPLTEDTDITPARSTPVEV